MNTIFENNCTYTYDYYLQLKRKTMDRGAQNTGLVFLVIFIALAVLTVVKEWYMFTFAAVIGIVFLIYRLFFMPILLAKFATRKNREIHGKDIKTINNFYEDHVLAVNTLSKSQTSIYYIDMLKIQQTRDLYIIGMEKGLVLMIDKHGFTKGTREDFIAFLKEKCVNAEVQI